MKNFLSYFKSKEAKTVEATSSRKTVPERVVIAIQTYRNKSKK